MNIAAAAVAMATAGRVQTSASRPGERVGLTRRAWLLLGAAFLSGGILLGLEVIWFRFGLLFIRGDDIGFAVMLATVLAGIGLGGLMAGRALAWRQGTTNGSTAIALLCGALVITLYKSLGTFLGPTTLYTPVFYGLFMMFPVALMSGALFPLLGEALNRELHAEMRSAGLLTLANTFGAMIGPLLAAFVLLPELGIELSMRLLAAAYGGVALLCLAGGAVPGSKPGAVLLGLTAAAMLYSVVVFPTGLMKTHYISRVIQANDPDHTYRTVAIREGLTETIIYLQADAWGRPVNHRMLTNSYSMSATNLSGLRYMRLYVQLPVAIHADMRSALLISYGVGTTAKALTDTRSFERIDMVDISRDVFEMNDIVYPDPATHPLGDPRVHVHIDDGRYYLQTTQRRYDLITGEPPPPKMAGVVNLYTREYFELVRSRLAEGGITTYWLPVHSLEPGDAKAIIRGFCDAFDDCTLWGGAALNWMLVGTRDAQGPVSREAFSRQWSDAVVGPQLRDVGIEAPAQLGSLFMAGADDLRELTADTPPLIDDYPLRLSHTASPVPHLNEVFWPWMETEVAAERFLTSELVKRLWPGELLVESLAWFDVQAALNHVLMQRVLPRSEKLAAIDRALANPSLRSLPLLQMGGGPVQERAALAAWEDGDRGIELRYHRALGAIADRDFALAADLLAVVRPTGHRRPWTVIYEIYSLCRAGRKERAAQLLRQVEIEIELWEVLSDVCARPAR
jgi:predicted membrane-bound spermidine synthase